MKVVVGSMSNDHETGMSLVLGISGIGITGIASSRGVTLAVFGGAFILLIAGSILLQQ